MHDPKKRTNPFLVLIAVVICLFLGAVIPQSSADPERISRTDSSDMIIADADEQQKKDTKKTEVTKPAEPSQKAEDTATPSPAPVQSDVSPEAASGIWTSSGSNWLFMVDGTPYTGWLTDTDGKKYFFNSGGIMQTGWLTDNGKRYYLDADGIMLKGRITVDGQDYLLLADGSLDGYVDESPTPAPEAVDTSEAVPSQTASAADQTPKYVALTFDDGPSSFTDRLLDCLEANNARATFFMVGKEIASFPDEVKRMEKLGCELGNHTYDHVDLTTLSPEDMSAQIAGVDDALVNLTGHGATVLRPPYGAVNDSVRSTVGTPMILWSIDTLDWKTQNVEQVVETALSEVQDGSVILMHDIFSTSVDAAEILVPKLIQEGYQLVTVHELASLHKTELKTGITYGDFIQ